MKIQCICLGLDINMYVDWSTAAMLSKGRRPETVTRTNFKYSFWTPAQMLTHHASNGCDLEPGDLLGSGTISGPADDSRACLAEMSEKGTASIDVGGERRVWLEDGDEINFRARAEHDGFALIGFGDCRGRVVPSVPWPNA